MPPRRPALHPRPRRAAVLLFLRRFPSAVIPFHHQSAPLTAPPPTSSTASPSFPSPSMKGASSSTKGKGSRVKGGSRRRPFHTPMSWMQRRRSHVRGVKLASYSSSDGSPERPVKVVVVGADVGSSSDGSRVYVPVYGGGDRIPRSSDKIGESGSSLALAAGGQRPNEPVKLGVCDGGRSKEAVKLGANGSVGSPERVVNIGRGRILVDNLGQLYVPDSEEEEGGSGGGCRQQKAVCARLAAARAAGYKRGRAVVPNLATQMASIADPAPEVAKAVDIPVGNAATPDELHPDLKGWLIVFVIRVGQLILVKLDVNNICIHAKVVYDIVEGHLVPVVGH